MKFSMEDITKQRHKTLMSNLKKYYKEDDDIWDKEFIDKVITEFFVVEEYKWNKKIKVDKRIWKKHNLIVKTPMFWWIAKHLNNKIAVDFGKQLYNLT